MYGVASGTDENITLTVPAAITELKAGMHFIFRPAHDNVTITPVININALGWVNILSGSNIEEFPYLLPNDILADIDAHIVFDGTYFRLQNPQAQIKKVVDDDRSTFIKYAKN